MDKNPTQLDPKLKEAYDRVMGTVVTPKSASHQEQPRYQENTQSPPPPQQPIQNANQQAPQTPPTLVPQEKNKFVKKKGISPLIIIVGVIALLAVYTFVWIKIFNISLF